MSDQKLYAIRDLIASHIACEKECQDMPTGCGCALTAARAVLGRAQGAQEIDAWMRADGSAATVNPMTAGMWKAQGHTILPLYLHAGRAALAPTSTDDKLAAGTGPASRGGPSPESASPPPSTECETPMSLHIYRSPGQSLIKEQRCPWIMRGFKLPAWKPNALLWARCCSKRRPAKNLFVQHYYDGSYIGCLPGKGCKSEAHAKLLAKRKSVASRAGWKTRRKASTLPPAERTAVESTDASQSFRKP